MVRVVLPRHRDDLGTGDEVVQGLATSLEQRHEVAVWREDVGELVERLHQ